MSKSKKPQNLIESIEVGDVLVVSRNPGLRWISSIDVDGIILREGDTIIVLEDAKTNKFDRSFKILAHHKTNEYEKSKQDVAVGLVFESELKRKCVKE